MRRWGEVRATLLRGLTLDERSRREHAMRDARIRYAVLKCEYIECPVEEVQRVARQVDWWWNELTDVEKKFWRVWYRREKRNLNMIIAERRRPGARQRITRMHEMYRRRK